MLPASAEYLAYEALPFKPRPAVRATFYPYLWPQGINVDGEFVECAFVAPDRVQADYHGFTSGYWISAVVATNMQVSASNAVITFIWNSPGFDLVVYYRAAESTTDLAAAAWTAIESGDTIAVKPFYQFKMTLEGYRAWAVDDMDSGESWADSAYSGDSNDPDDFTAYAVDEEEDSGVSGDSYEDFMLSYAGDDNVTGDPLTYIEGMVILGEFSIMEDIENPGSLTMEVPQEFDDLVAGDHSGLTLNNRQGSFVGGVWVPAPLFSPNKSSFFLSGQDWYDINLKIELGWYKGGFMAAPFLESPLFSPDYTDFITLFEGRVKEWGPVNSEVDESAARQPATVEIYATDLIMDALKRRIALPAADGSPNPKTYGEFLCEGIPVSGWSPVPPLKLAYFESNNYDELAGVVESGGGDVSLITPGLTGDRALRAAVTGANQSAYGRIRLSTTSEMFITGSVRFTAVPGTISAANMTWLKIIGTDGNYDEFVSIDGNGQVVLNSQYDGGAGESGDFNILGYLDVPLSFALWWCPEEIAGGGHGFAKLWINGDEVANYEADWHAEQPIELQFGAITGVVAESWTIDFDDLEIRNKYYRNAFQVYGGPFAAIGPVYIDNVAQPPTKTIGAVTQTLTRFPEYGMVSIISTDSTWNPNDVMIRVIEHAGGRHALEIITLLLAEAGLTDYIDATALAAAYVACPDDIIHARFEGGEAKGFGLKDIAELGISVADAIKEITARCLYWIFMDAGNIKIVPYTGTPAASPEMALTASNKWASSQTIDLNNINSYVSATYGWYERNPTLFYLAGDASAGADGVGRDYTWGSPVACESREVVKAKVDLLLKFLSAREIIDPVSLGLDGARLELRDVVSLRDVLLNDAAENYYITRKEVNLETGSRGTNLTLTKYLGES